VLVGQVRSTALDLLQAASPLECLLAKIAGYETSRPCR
jgi:hypothetical protein